MPYVAICGEALLHITPNQSKIAQWNNRLVILAIVALSNYQALSHNRKYLSATMLAFD